MSVLLEQLRVLQQMPCKDHRGGICCAVTETEQLHALFKLWPHYSGDECFPIPAPEGDYRKPKDLYYYHADLNLWDIESEYCKMRYELLDWCVETLSCMSELLQELKQLQDSLVNKRHNYGICCYLSEPCRLVFICVAQQWPEHSGSNLHPVPSQEFKPMAAYITSRGNHTLWDTSTEYGRKRHELLAWAIEQLEVTYGA